MKFVLSALLLLAIGAGARPEPPDLRRLIELESKRSFSAELVTGLFGGDPQVAARAALALGRTKDARAGAPLRAQLGNREPAVRAMAAYGLGLLADGNSEQALVRMLRSDRTDAVRLAAADALGRAGASRPIRPELLEAALEAALDDRSPLVRSRAATSLEVFRTGAWGDRASRALLAAFARERVADVRWHLMWAIFRGYAIRVPRAFLVRASRDPEELVRVEAVRALGRLKDERVVAILRPLRADPSWRVQLEAREAIRRLRGEPPTEHQKELPAEIHLPAVAPASTEGAQPRPAPTGKPVAPQLAEVSLGVPFAPSTANRMNGPLPGVHPRVRVTTTKGTFVVRLYPEWAPLTVANFLNLTRHGYYDGLRWFRVVPDFVVQTGDPNDDGEGDAGYMIPAEENPVEQRAGVISMGLNYENDGPLRDSAGTQFYLTLSPQLHLNRDFTVFGEVESGFAVLAHLVEADRMLRVEQIGDVAL